MSIAIILTDAEKSRKPRQRQKCCPLFLATGTRKEGNKTGVVACRLPRGSRVRADARPEVEFSRKITIRLEIFFTIENPSSSCVVGGGGGRWDDLFSPLHPATSSLFVYEQILLKANISDKRGENKHPNRTSFHRCEQ